MFIRVSNERVIAGEPRTPGDVIEVSDADGKQAIEDGYAKAMESGSRPVTSAPQTFGRIAQAQAVEPDPPTSTDAVADEDEKPDNPQPDPKVAPQPTESLQKVDPDKASAPRNIKK